MVQRSDIFDVIVIGGGHAGCEAYAAACRIGARTALVSPDLDRLAVQPCNPAVGGPGKGHLVREVVALGGLMGRVTDACGLQFRTLNIRKGPAVRATRVQTDSELYVREMSLAVRAVEGGVLVADRVIGLVIGPDRRIAGVKLDRGGSIDARSVVVATGTFLRGVIHVGPDRSPGGRRGEPPTTRLALALQDIGLPLIRLKTGTCPRLDAATLDLDSLETQRGDDPPPFFDPGTTATILPQLPCHVTYTDERAHAVVRANLGRSALFGGRIKGVGPRYCPSIETKVVRFPDKERHQIFLEPEDRTGRVIYPSGLSTSLPIDAQEDMVHAVPGLERARIVRYGYAIEYDALQPRGLRPTLEADGLPGLYFAGQVIGTSGYEEAAALGLIAGANAALAARGDSPLVLGRHEAYIGVMVDDLTTRGVDEPYRMLTSRAEHRLLLREDNADERLVEAGARAGLVPPWRAERIRAEARRTREAAERLCREVLTPSAETNARLSDHGLPAIAKPTALADLLRRADVRVADLLPVAPWLADLPRKILAALEVDVKYERYVEREREEIGRMLSASGFPLPRNLDYRAIPGLRAEMAERLSAVRPETLGQASRIPGVTPAAVQIVHVFCRR